MAADDRRQALTAATPKRLEAEIHRKAAQVQRPTGRDGIPLFGSFMPRRWVLPDRNGDPPQGRKEAWDGSDTHSEADALCALAVNDSVAGMETG
jgi:hypothetical protein